MRLCCRPVKNGNAAQCLRRSRPMRSRPGDQCGTGTLLSRLTQKILPNRAMPARCPASDAGARSTNSLVSRLSYCRTSYEFNSGLATGLFGSALGHPAHGVEHRVCAAPGSVVAERCAWFALDTATTPAQACQALGCAQSRSRPSRLIGLQPQRKQPEMLLKEYQSSAQTV